jgi:hypothetical protein
LNGPDTVFWRPLDRPESQRGASGPHPVDQHAVLLAHTLYHQGMSYQDIANHFNMHRFRLPDGQKYLRTKCIRNKRRAGHSTETASARSSATILCRDGCSPANSPLDMDDDRAPGIIESAPSKKPRKLPDGMSRRSILEMHRGRHDGIVPLSLWQANQQERKSRGNTPRAGNRPVHEYVLSGVGYCWECHHWDGRQASLHGISGNRYKYYRCSTVQGEYKTRNKPHPEVFNTALNTLGLGAEEQTSKLELLDRHRSTLQQNLLEEQVNRLVEPFAVPEEWYELILAYYLSDKGMSEFELSGYNLRQELSRQRELYKRGHITQAEYEQAFLYIDRQLQKLKPSAQPEAREIIPLLNDFPTLWQHMTLTERRALLQAMFAGLYFDSQCQLRKVSARGPFDQLIDLVVQESHPSGS